MQNIALLFLSFILLLNFSSCIETPKSKVVKKDLAEERMDDTEDDEYLDDDTYDEESDDIDELSDVMDADETDDDSAQAVLSSNKENVNTSPYDSGSQMAGSYMVVVGNFIIEQNAKDYVERMKEIGFLGAEITIFEHSSFYTVNIGRFEEESGAQSIMEDYLAEHPEMEAYIHIRK